MTHEAIDAEVVNSVPAVRERSSLVLVPVMDLQSALARLKEFEEFCAHYLTESKDGGNDGGDYGLIPGTKKKALLKSGSDKLCEIYGLYDEYVVMSSVENWDKGLFDYVLKCILRSRRDDSMVGSGVGSCSSFESKYRWRDAKRLCPACNMPTIIKGRDFSGQNKPAGWVCWKKPGKSDGCGATFKDGDKAVEDQTQGRVENPDIIDVKNTVLKMAKKRAKVDATIGATRSSGIFTQDLDDIPMPAEKPKREVTSEEILLERPKPGSTIRPSTDADGTGEFEPEQPRSKSVSMFDSDKAVIVERQNMPVATTTFSSDTHNYAPDVQLDVKDAAASKKPASTEEPLFPGCIDKGRKVAFARAWKAALPLGMWEHAEVLRADWLARHGYLDDQGNPTSGKIPMADFEAVKRDAIKFAAGLSQPGTQPSNYKQQGPKFVADDGDVPF